MPSFAVSICILSLVQAALVLLPAARDLSALKRFSSGWWALIPAASVIGFVFGIRELSGLADGLTYLALVAVPLLAAVALGWLMRGARPLLAIMAIALFVVAWADRRGLAGEGAGLLLEALSCVTLAVLLVTVTPRRLVKLAIVAMAAVDTWLVASDLLTAPNDTFNAIVPVAHLPQLQRVLFGDAVMGYGDLFIAALLGALLAAQFARQRRAALIAAGVGLAMNLLFFVVDELPATVPIALTLLALEAGAWRSRRAANVGGPAP
jgi:hypothetical protein